MRCFVHTCIVVALVATVASAQSASWNQLSPPASPPGRAALAMTYDAANQQIVAFGGYSAAVGYFQDTWTFDGTTWTQRSPATSPPGRAAATIVYDAPTQKCVLFGGFNGAYLGDTWVWDGALGTWTQNTTTPSPTAVTGPMGFVDPLTSHAMIYGGFRGMFYELSTWRWNGAGWTQLSPATSPYARAAGVAISDPAHGKVVLFGGLGSVNPNNTWTWDGTNWQMESPTTQPALRYYSSGAFEPALGHPILFGGGSGGVDQQDTWEWTGSDWQQLAPTASPSPRESMALAYHAASGHVVLFGGDFDDGPPFFDETWRLDVVGNGNAFCAGDGSGTACPCGNASAPGSSTGCLSSLGIGGKLTASGSPSVSADSFVLHGSQMPNSAVLYFQGTASIGSGAGAVFGDGLRCAGGTVTRLGVKTNASGASQYPGGADPSISVRGNVTSPVTRTYQAWYRNSAAFCTASTFNLTNGWTVSWAP